MLQYDALEQLCRDRVDQRRREADSERLALEARRERQQGRRSGRTARLTLLLRAVRHASGA